MDAAEGPDIENDVDLDDEDLSPRIRQFLEAIVERDAGGPSPGDRRRMVDRERRVSRFSWTCEELNVAFSDIKIDEETVALLTEHGVPETLTEIQTKTAALLEAIRQR
jgi:hypothetical protein